jgi:hypothetical protein
MLELGIWSFWLALAAVAASEQLYRPLNFGSSGPRDPNHQIQTSKLQRNINQQIPKLAARL